MNDEWADTLEYEYEHLIWHLRCYRIPSSSQTWQNGKGPGLQVSGSQRDLTREWECLTREWACQLLVDWLQHCGMW